MTGFIAVHCGAGFHGVPLRPKYKKLCREACKAAAKILNAGGTALLACQTAVMVLEDNPMTNAGFGSSLSITGQVECDASVMDGQTLNFGACGAVKGVKYPISLASQICLDQLIPRSLQRIPPSILVGDGATNYARKSNLTLINNKRLISSQEHKRYVKHKRNISEMDVKSEVIYERLDTVGAVCVDGRGHVASACSSGGLSLKDDGRVGQAASYACGVWADSIERSTKPSVAVSTTGTGEYIIKTLLAKELGTKIKDSNCPALAFHKCMKEDFLESKYLADVRFDGRRIAGALVLCVTPSGQGELLWGHSSRTMGIAYMDASLKVTSTISEMPAIKAGQTITMSGIHFSINPEPPTTVNFGQSADTIYELMRTTAI